MEIRYLAIEIHLGNMFQASQLKPPPPRSGPKQFHQPPCPKDVARYTIKDWYYSPFYTFGELFMTDSEFDVVGIGNAIVDVLVQTEDTFLKTTPSLRVP